MSVLEHCKNPFKLCSNIVKLLDKDGVVFINAPFSWRPHDYPGDFWRFTPEGIKLLFPNLQFLKIFLASSTVGDIELYLPAIGIKKIEIGFAKNMERKDCFGVLLGIMKKLKLLPKRFRYPYLIPPTTVSMIGRKIC